MERVILHSDLNCFYASVEMVLDPSLKGKALAVCGSVEDRHGIVLAKSEPAKRSGVKTGMTASEAKALCPGLVLVEPKFHRYAQFSEMVRKIYLEYTDLVEPFGMDECWLDVTGSQGLFGRGEVIAETIRERIKQELGLTVSIGVSFNKIFAKLGSDMKKPDAVTVITEENFREKVWKLPVGDLLYVGPATKRKLELVGVTTIGQLAAYPRENLVYKLGVNGGMIHDFACGLDRSAVRPCDLELPVYSFSHGTTLTADLHSPDEVWRVILYLCADLSRRLYAHGSYAEGIQLTVKSNDLNVRQFQRPLTATRSQLELAQGAFSLLGGYSWQRPIRAVTVGAIKLSSENSPRQIGLFDSFAPDAAAAESVTAGKGGGRAGKATDAERSFDYRLRREKLEETVISLEERFGHHTVKPAALLSLDKLPRVKNETVLPGMMFR